LPPTDPADRHLPIAEGDFHNPQSSPRPATHKLEPGTARDIMRSYGVSFEALEGEIPEPGDVPVVPVAPAAS
jgi:hypothetical protein